MGSISNRVRVNVGTDKESVKSRVDRCTGVATAAPKSPIYQAKPEVKAACDALVARGAQLAAADAAVQAAELELAKARGARDVVQTGCNAAYDVCVAQVEQNATTTEEVLGLGFLVLGRSSYGIAAPTEVRARFDSARGLLRIHVPRAPGMRTVVIEISSDAAEPRTWSRLPGVGFRREVANLAPGTHWVRAASVRASEQSEFSAPIAVTVR